MKGGRKVNDLYADLLEVIEPYLSDFTGYDEEEQAFNIVLAVKELLSEFNIENERLKKELATYGATGVCEVCSDKANKLADKYLGCLQEIKAIAIHEIKELTDSAINGGRYLEILDLITKAESEG